MLHLDISSIAEQRQGEVDDVDLLRRGESDHVCGCTVASLNAAVQPSRVPRRWRRIGETLAVKFLEPYPKTDIFGIDPYEGIHDPIPIAPAKVAIRVRQLA